MPPSSHLLCRGDATDLRVVSATSPFCFRYSTFIQFIQDLPTSSAIIIVVAVVFVVIVVIVIVLTRRRIIYCMTVVVVVRGHKTGSNAPTTLQCGRIQLTPCMQSVTRYQWLLTWCVRGVVFCITFIEYNTNLLENDSPTPNESKKKEKKKGWRLKSWVSVTDNPRARARLELPLGNTSR